MRLKQTLAVVFVALFLMGQTSPKTVTVIYAPSDPTTATCKSGQTWQNTSAAGVQPRNSRVVLVWLTPSKRA